MSLLFWVIVLIGLVATMVMFTNALRDYYKGVGKPKSYLHVSAMTVLITLGLLILIVSLLGLGGALHPYV